MESLLALRLQLLNQRETQAGLVETAGSVKVLGDAAETTGHKTAFAAEKNFLLGESIYSLRRYVFYGLTAIGATGGAILKMGYDFDEAKAKGVDALTSLVGGATQARTEVSKLIGITHDSGLGLSILVGASQNMLTFGFSVKQTNQYLAAFADFAGKMGTGEGGISSLAAIFEKIQSQGFLSGRELRQLTALGIPGVNVLTNSLGLSPSEKYLLQHGQGQVQASTALPALASWIQNYANKQPVGLSQEWGIIHSYLSQITGLIGTPVFGWLQRLGPGLQKTLSGATTGYQKNGLAGMFDSIDPSGSLNNGWKLFTGTLQAGGKVLQLVFNIVKLLSPVMAVFAAVLGVLTKNTEVLKVAVYSLAGYYALTRGIMLTNIIVTKALTVSEILFGSTVEANTALVINNTVATGTWTGATITQAGAVDTLTTSLDAAKIAAIGLYATLGIATGIGAIALAGYYGYKDRVPNPTSVTRVPGTSSQFISHEANGQHVLVTRTANRGPSAVQRRVLTKPLEIHVHTEVDGREIAHAVAKHDDIISESAAKGKAKKASRS